MHVCVYAQRAPRAHWAHAPVQFARPAAAVGLASTGCRRRQSRLLFARREGQRDVVYLAEPTGSRAPVRVLDELPGTVNSGVSIDDGRAMIAMVTRARTLRTVHADGAAGRSFGDAWTIAWVLE